MIRKLATTACISAAIVASLAGGASAKGSTWAMTPDGHTWAVTYKISPLSRTWALTPVKKSAVPSTTTWTTPTPAEVKLGISKIGGEHLMVPTNVTFG